MSRKAVEWPIKQLKKVQADVDKVAALTDRPGVKSVTLINGPENGFVYGLPEEYNEEMTRHAKVMAASGVKLVDLNPLLGATDRPDKLHTSLTDENLRNTVMWYRALVSGAITDRMITDLRPEFVANRREVVFYEHFHLNKPDSRLTVPGSMDLRVKPTPGLEVPPEVRDDDEQIVLTVPLLAPVQNLLLTEAEELTEVDRALLDTTPGAENVIQNTEDENDPAVVVTKMQLEGQGVEEATEEEIQLANALGVFGLDLGIGRTSDEDAGSEKVFKGVEELTPEERSKDTVYYARGSVGIQKLMREMQIETEKKPPESPACCRRAQDHGCYAAEQEAACYALCCGIIFVVIGSVAPHGSAGQILGSCTH